MVGEQRDVKKRHQNVQLMKSFQWLILKSKNARFSVALLKNNMATCYMSKCGIWIHPVGLGHKISVCQKAPAGLLQHGNARCLCRFCVSKQSC
jgi:hypothetical protein